MRFTIFLCALAALARAQSASSPAGLEPAWDIAVVLNEIGANAARLAPVLSQVDTAAWVAQGASETYGEQLQSSRQQARAVADAARALARNPEKLSAGLELFFRFEGLERMLGSIEDGARRYQGAPVAAEIASVYGEGGANRERFRQYIVNLAAERERQFEVMDQEAQRCRATLQAPPPPKATVRKK